MKSETIYIYGAIGEDWWEPENDITDRSIKDQLADYADADEINVNINSMGGYTHHGVAIYNILTAHTKKMKLLKPNFTLNTIVDGFAFSAASIIFLAGEKRKMGLGTRLMIHNPWTFAMGDYRDMEKMVTYLKTAQASLASMYSTIADKDEKDILQLMDDETYFNADEAVEMGFATEMDEKESDNKDKNRKEPYEQNVMQHFEKLHKMPKGSYQTAMLACKAMHRPKIKQEKISGIKPDLRLEALQRDLILDRMAL